MNYIKNFKKFFEGLTGKPKRPRWSNSPDGLLYTTKKDAVRTRKDEIDIATVNKDSNKINNVKDMPVTHRHNMDQEYARKRMKVGPQHIQNINYNKNKNEIDIDDLDRKNYLQDKIKDFIKNNILTVNLKKIVPNKHAGYFAANNNAYVLYTFYKDARKQLIEYGFAATLDTTKPEDKQLIDPIYIFLNVIKGGTKYRPYLSQVKNKFKKQKRKRAFSLLYRGNLEGLITNVFITDLLYESSRLLHNWWQGKFGGSPIAIYAPESAPMKYPPKYAGKSFNEHWLENLKKVFSVNNIGPDVKEPIRKKKGEELSTVYVDTNPYSEGDYQHEPGMPSEEQYRLYHTNDDGTRGEPKVVTQITSIPNTINNLRLANKTITVKNISPINRWRLHHAFYIQHEVLGLSDKQLLNIITNNQKILLIDDNLVTGTTIFDIAYDISQVEFEVGDEKYKIPLSNIICVAMFYAETKYRQSDTEDEREDIIQLINDKERERDEERKARRAKAASEWEDKYLQNLYNMEELEKKRKEQK